MARKLLIDDFNPVHFILEESADGKNVARGRFGRVDVPTENGRVYGRTIMERERKRLSEAMSNRAFFGELDHPQDGKTKLARCSHIVTEMKITEDGEIIAAAEILPTPNGKILKALFEANCRVGVSSRGFGSTTPGPKGEMVGEDFKLKAFDFVADPATKDAHPDLFSEDIDEVSEEDILTELKESYPELFVIEEGAAEEQAREKATTNAEKAVAEAVRRTREETEARMTETFERRLAEELSGLREGLGEEIREEYAADPKRGGATAILESIAEMVAEFRDDPDERAVHDALKAKDLEIATVTEQRNKAMKLGRKAGYKLRIEQRIGSHPMAATIRKLLPFNPEENRDDLDARLDTILTDLPESVEEGRSSNVNDDEYEALESENASLKEEAVGLRAENEELARKLRKAVSIGEKLDRRANDALARAEEAEETAENALEEAELAKSGSKSAKIEAYKVSAVAGMSNGRQLLSLLEGVEDAKEVDRMVAKYRRAEMSDAELEGMRRNLRHGAPDAARSLEEEASGVDSVVDELAGSLMGVPMSEMQQLAGIK